MIRRLGGARAATAGALLLGGLAAQAAGAAESPPGVGTSIETAPAPASVRARPLLLLQGELAPYAETGPDPAFGDPPPGAAARLRRARLGLEATAGLFETRVVFEAYAPAATQGPLDGGHLSTLVTQRLTDAFLSFAPHKAFRLDFGAQRVPFSQARQIEEGDLRLPEPPVIVHQATPDWRTGIGAGGNLGLLQYRVAVLSGATTASGISGGGLTGGGGLVAVRLGTEPIGPMGVAPWRRRSDDVWYPWWRFAVGASLIYGTLQSPGALGAGGDAQLQWKRLTVAAEYIWVRQAAATQQGAALEPGVFIIRDRLQLTARTDWYQSTLAAAGAPVVQIWTHALGFTYLGDANGRVRLQAAFARRHHTDRADRDTSMALLRATIVL